MLDLYGVIFGSLEDRLMRAKAAVMTGRFPGALAITARLEAGLRQRPQGGRLVREALQILEDIPRKQLNSSSRAMIGRIRAAAAGGRLRRVQRGVR